MKKNRSFFLCLAASLALTLPFGGCAGKRSAAGGSAVSSSTVSVSSAVDSESSSEPEESAAAPSETDSLPAPSSAAASHAAASSKTVQTATITIPEGFTASQIAARLEANGVCKGQAFLSALNSFSCSGYPNAAAISYNPNQRCYKLEGYLYPDTYAFYKPEKPTDVIARMLRNEENRIGSRYSYPGMTTDQLITLASIIQKEAASYSDMVRISCVFHNRLKQGMALQSDATVFYLTKGYLPSGLVDTYKYYYNTVRRCKGLPAGPICSPGANALRASANPANAGYLYFASDAAGNYYFAETYAQQVQNLNAHGAQSPETSAASVG